MAARRKVALLIGPDSGYSRDLLRGVASYMREQEPWSIFHAEYGRGEVVPAALSNWSGDGIIARIVNREIADAVVNCGLPVVDLATERLVPEAPAVTVDHDAVALLATEHFLDRGFVHFAYCGDEQLDWSRRRGEFFCRHVADAGYACHVYRPTMSAPTGGLWQLMASDLIQWIGRLPKPAGLFASWDGHGQQVLDACDELGVAVPDELAVLGVHNDQLVCELSDPPLSSIALDAPRCGRLAAEILDDMMRGRRAEPRWHLVPPLGVVQRQSTDVLAVDDPQVAEAVRYIRENARYGIRVADVVAAVSMSKRLLESRFRKHLGRSPHQEILRVRVGRAKALLAETDLPIGTVAQRTGFDPPEYMTVVFQRLVGQSPASYRRQFRK